MKKLLAILLAAAMLFSFAACGESGGEETADTYEIIMLMDLPGGSVDDGSFCEATWDGIERYCEENKATCN